MRNLHGMNETDMDKRIFLGLVLAFTADCASATTFMLSCEGCSGDEARARLTQHAIERQIELPTPVYAANVGGNQLFSYAPVCSRRADQVPMRPGAPDDRNKVDPAIRTAASPLCVEYRFDEIAPDSVHAGFFAELRKLHLDSGGSMRKTMEIDSAWIGGGIPFGQMDGFDVVGDTALRTAIGDAIRDHCFLCRAELAQGTMLGVSFLTPVSPVIEFRVTFRDGVSFLVRWEYPNSQLEYVLGSGRTAGGQFVPDSAPEPGSTYTYFFGSGYPDSLLTGSDMLDYLRRWWQAPGTFGGSDFMLVCAHREKAPPICAIQQI